MYKSFVPCIALIWYTGHGERHTGNWCFKDGTISFTLIINLYQTFFQGKLLYLICDCAHAGQWVMNFANFLEDKKIAACGHKAKEKGYLLKIFASCQPEQTAKKFCFPTSGVKLGPREHISFIIPKEIAPTQTTFGKDFTKLLCFRDIDQKCRVGELTHYWTWLDSATNQRSTVLFDFVHLVTGTDKGRDAWYYVLLHSSCKEQFNSSFKGDRINLAEQGIVVYSGWGNKPPDKIKEKMQAFTQD